ncbi:MAG TPA: alpha/beta hydrolase [Puia sp.]|nr:alpha/beta hydrolase [Puia sp.]
MKEIAYSPQVLASFEAAKRLVESIPPAGNPLETQRDLFRRLGRATGTPEAVFHVEDYLIGDQETIPVRIYRPSDNIDLPVILFFHGGWFVIGDLESHDALARLLTNACACVVIAVDYRLAPEHPFPAAIDDAYEALVWVSKNSKKISVDSGRMAVAGDSAGGNIAAVVARKARENGLTQLRYQALIYPVTDSSFSTESWNEFAEGPVITKTNSQQAFSMYVASNKNLQNPDVAPVLAENLNGLPPAMVIIGQFDPLRDEGLAYAVKLIKAGVDVKLIHYHGMPHGFVQSADRIDAGKDAIAEIGNAIRKALQILV